MHLRAQGMGYGGSSVFSGNLFQRAPGLDFDSEWVDVSAARFLKASAAGCGCGGWLSLFRPLLMWSCACTTTPCPQGWRSFDMQPFFERVAEMVSITTTPSTDREHYADGAALLMADFYRGAGIPQARAHALRV